MHQYSDFNQTGPLFLGFRPIQTLRLATELQVYTKPVDSVLRAL